MFIIEIESIFFLLVILLIRLKHPYMRRKKQMVISHSFKRTKKLIISHDFIW
jgi:hypothetical protein